MTHPPAGTTGRAPRRGATGPLALVKHLRGVGFSAIDPATHEPLGTVGEGRQPHAMAIHPAGRWAYVPYMASGTVEVIDLRGPRVAAAVDAGTAPVGAALSRGGRYLLVGTYGPMPGVTEPGLMAFETSVATGELALLERFELGPCAGIAATETNDVWVALKDGDAVVRLSGPPYSVRDRIEVPAGPEGLTYAPEHGLVGVSCVGADRVALLDAGRGVLLAEAAAPNPRGGAVVDGTWFVSDTEGDGLTVVGLDAPERGIETERLRLGTPTAFTDTTPDGSLLVADAYEGDRVTFLDPASLEVLARPRTGGAPRHARFGTDGRTCYVPNVEADTVTVLDVSGLPDGTVERIAEITVPEGAAPSGCYFTDRRIGR